MLILVQLTMSQSHDLQKGSLQEAANQNSVAVEKRELSTSDENPKDTSM
jgi:hypothetical protein